MKTTLLRYAMLPFIVLLSLLLTTCKKDDDSLPCNFVRVELITLRDNVKRTEIYELNEKDLLVKTASSLNDTIGYTEYSYNSKNQLKEIHQYDEKMKCVYQRIFEYDSLGNVYKVSTYEPCDSLTHYSIYENDSLGYPIKRKLYFPPFNGKYGTDEYINSYTSEGKIAKHFDIRGISINVEYNSNGSISKINYWNLIEYKFEYFCDKKDFILQDILFW